MDASQPSYTLLDGATATNLQGVDLSGCTCIEEYLLENPTIITTLQAQFVEAGSDIIYAPTFSANHAMLARFDAQDRVCEVNKQLVALTKSVAGGRQVAGNLSATGLTMEPYGDASFDEIYKIYCEQAKALCSAGVDLFVIETMMSLGEARAAVLACRKYKKPIYVTFTVNERGNTVFGGTPLCCLIALQDLGVAAFGLNCSFGPALLTPFIEELAAFSRIPIIAKPNAGMPNLLLPQIYDLSPEMMREEMVALLDAGATIIGGCCGTTPEHIKQMRELLDMYIPVVNIHHVYNEGDIMLSNEHEAYSLDNERIEFTEPIICEYDMADSFIEAEDDSVDVLLIHINTIDDALLLAKNVHLAKLPICLYATNEKALDIALKLYHGKAMVDATSPIEIDVLTDIARRYGGIVY